ncbi:MAG: ABC transporter ATP-binding protein [Caldisphaeraceae archaeon]|nr:ABC transporter ATP-binding protein [Caldisphaeraceae archaeon]
MLKVENLSSGYGSLKIIDGVSFEIKKNKVLLILGLNGAGKTTLLKTIAGFLRPFSGKILLEEKDITNLNAYQKAKTGITMITEYAIFPDLTVKENLEIANSKNKGSDFKAELKNILKIFPELTQFLNFKAQALSGGQRKILSMAMAILSKPKLLILDEPSTGLSPLLVSRIIKYTSMLKDMQITMLIAEQNPSFITVSDYVLVMDSGKIKLEGKTNEMYNNDEIRKTFFQIT